MKCEWCKDHFEPHPNNRQRYCTEDCRDAHSYWHVHVECYQTPEVPRPPRPFVFCRTGYHAKCPHTVNAQPCICECHA